MLKERIEKKKSDFWLDQLVEPDLMVMRPEVKQSLIMEIFDLSPEQSLGMDVNTYDGMDIAVCDDECFPDFKLATYSCSGIRH